MARQLSFKAWFTLLLSSVTAIRITRPISTIVAAELSLSGHPWNGSVELTTSGQIATLDYGKEVAGLPYFEVKYLSKPVQIEVKYSEAFIYLNDTFGDGPFAFSTGVSNTYRVETFNVTKTGPLQSFFIQGGQRWESIKLLTDGQITFSNLGLIPSVDQPNLDDLPGHFECSNELYNKIWKLGAEAVSVACIEAGTQSSLWEVSDEGSYIRGQKTSPNALGSAMVNYNLSFSTKIVRGGSGWSLAQPVDSTGIQLLLISNLPEETSFINTNRTLTPPNSIILSYGYNLVNQTSITTYQLDIFSTPFKITEGEWYNVSTALSDANYVTTYLNGWQVFNISLADYGITLSCPYCSTFTPGSGGWGFGPWQDQVAIVKDVLVTSSNGTILYQNDLKDGSVLQEYGVAENNGTVCLDGAKRDRLVWLGDFYHTAQIIPASTSRKDFVFGTYDYLFEWQIEDGEISVSAQLGYSPSYKELISGGKYGLPDYQILGLSGFANYFTLTNDTATAQRLWPGFEKQINFLLNQIDNSTKLSSIGGFIGPANGTATSAALVQALNGAAGIAESLGYKEKASNYKSVAAETAKAVNNILWNHDLGVYSLSTTSAENYSLADISFVITSGIANSSRVASLLSKLDNLKLSPGYKDSTVVASSSPATVISPNINGFLLSALMKADDTNAAKYLLDNLWKAMVSNDSTTTGTSWEYVDQKLGPGLGSITSLSHPWGAAPTYILPQWLGGLRPVSPGYSQWAFTPAINGFNLTWANTRIQTQWGKLSAHWVLHTNNQTIEVKIKAPANTKGQLQLPGMKTLGNWTLNGISGKGGESVPLTGGTSSIILHI